MNFRCYAEGCSKAMRQIPQRECNSIQNCFIVQNWTYQNRSYWNNSPKIWNSPYFIWCLKITVHWRSLVHLLVGTSNVLTFSLRKFNKLTIPWPSICRNWPSSMLLYFSSIFRRNLFKTSNNSVFIWHKIRLRDLLGRILFVYILSEVTIYRTTISNWIAFTLIVSSLKLFRRNLDESQWTMYASLRLFSLQILLLLLYIFATADKNKGGQMENEWWIKTFS